MDYQDNAIGRLRGAKCSTASTAVLRMCIRRGTHSLSSRELTATEFKHGYEDARESFVLYCASYSADTVNIACRVSILACFDFSAEVAQPFKETKRHQKTTQSTKKPSPHLELAGRSGSCTSPACAITKQGGRWSILWPIRGQLGIKVCLRESWDSLQKLSFGSLLPPAIVDCSPTKR